MAGVFFMTLGKILLIGFAVSLVIAQFAIILQLKDNCHPCDEPWVAGEKPDSLDHGPYKIRTDQIKDGAVTESRNANDRSFGLFYQFDQSTGQIDSIWFKGERIYPIKVKDSTILFCESHIRKQKKLIDELNELVKYVNYDNSRLLKYCK